MLWARDELKTLFGLDAEASGISIDTRAIAQGDLFFGLVGENGADGMQFAAQAMEKGAVGAIAGLNNLEKLGQAARARCDAQRIAVTGSVGKTGSKELLATVFGAYGKTHASTASFNNHIGVPLTLARMPRDTEFGVFEMGMNHAGELRELGKQVRPHVTMITWIAPAHLEFFSGLEAIADAKSEIFESLEVWGAAVLPTNSPQFDRLWSNASKAKVERLITFGWHETAMVRLIEYKPVETGARIHADVAGTMVEFYLPLPGMHVASNALGVLGCVHAVGQDVQRAAEALENAQAAPGRGERFMSGGVMVIDESYNANPESMRATLEVLATTPCHGRRIALLGDMFELGAGGPDLHAGLAQIIEKLPLAQVVTCGPAMRHLHEALTADQRGPHFSDSVEMAEALPGLLKREDCVLIKGSNGMKMKIVVQAIRSTFH